MSDLVKKTPLFDVHISLGARMTPFGGFEMPIQYSGIIDEHMAVRKAAGLFDVSHMGEIRVQGPHALAFIQHVITNDASKLYDGRVLYTVMCKPDGGIVDDLLVYRFNEEDYMLVVNASNIAKDYEWIESNNDEGADVENISEEVALLAIQGPEAFPIVQALTNVPLDEIKYYHFKSVSAANFSGLDDVILSHTGYTGEKGFEIYCRPERAVAIWEALMEAGAQRGLKPAGLGARDTLRLEAGFSLYGNDITAETNPLEAGLGWVVKMDKGDFIGREALEQIKNEGPQRKLVGLVMEERGIPRHGYPVLSPDGQEIGVVTSGSQSPILEKGIALAYVPNTPEFTTPGNRLAVAVRERALPAVVTKPPFHKKSS